MITLFSIPKPFAGHIGTIQTNAILSWKALHPEIDILIIGNEDGVAEFCQSHQLRHFGEVRCNEIGTPLLSSIFETAEAHAKFPVLTYVNADIILFPEFLETISRVPFKKYLLGGQRCDCDWDRPVDFGNPSQVAELKQFAKSQGVMRGFTAIDYFTFPKGLYDEIPDFAIGRVYWDNWLLFRARQLGAALINATDAIFAVHQNHDYRHATSSGTMNSVWNGSEAFANRALIADTIFTLREADWSMSKNSLRRHFEPSIYRLVNEIALQIGRHVPLKAAQNGAYWVARQMWDRNWRKRYADILINSRQSA